MITAEIVMDSLSPYGDSKDPRITTFVLEYPRIIHSEILTHRCFSRNCASSRAIPVERQLQLIEEREAAPIKWGTNNPGMQSNQDHEDPERCKLAWWKSAVQAVENARRLLKLKLHKQIANRVIEPYVFMRTVLTVNNHYGLMNFFWQRAHKDADPTLQVLAYKMLKAYINSVPAVRTHHAPFVDIDSFIKEGNTERAFKISAAKCAAVSYKRDQVDKTDEQWIEMFETKLVNQPEGSPLHLSPLEHQATAGISRCGNFMSWSQFRLIYEPGCFMFIDLNKMFNDRPEWVKKFV
jgi:hypothetical protein